MAWEARSGLKRYGQTLLAGVQLWLNGLGSPFGIETRLVNCPGIAIVTAKWPGKPVRD